MKAALVSVGIDPPRTHDIAEVVAELPGNMPLRDRLAARSRLTPYATGLRYLTHESPPLPSHEHIDAWVDEIGALKADFERWLEAREGEAGA